MSKPENTFIAAVHKHLPPGRANPYWMKNNNLYTAGIWDVWYSGAKCDLWVEYKFVEVPKRESTMIDVTLSELQVKWGRERGKEGRNLAVIIGSKEGGIIIERREDWERQWTRTEFAVALRSRKEIASWIEFYTQGGL